MLSSDTYFPVYCFLPFSIIAGNLVQLHYIQQQHPSACWELISHDSYHVQAQQGLQLVTDRSWSLPPRSHKNIHRHYHTPLSQA